GAEEMDQSVRECNSRAAVDTARSFVGRQHRAIAERVTRCVDDRLRELVRIAQPEVEPLPRDRMQRLRCVAYDDHARGNGWTRDLEPEREGPPPARAHEASGVPSERARELV